MTDADLIGYLLESLDANDRAVVETHLRANPDAVVQLERLRLALAPLEADREPDVVPTGLAVRTVARLAAHLVEYEPRQTKPSSPAELAAVHRALEEPDSTPAGSDEPLAFPAMSLPRAPREEPETRAVGGRLRFDLLVACGIALFAGALVISAVGKVRAQNQMIACKNTLHTIHNGLAGYADTNDGCYPQIGPNATADSFAATLVSSGQVPEGFRPACPAYAVSDPANPAAVGYTYTLGYRSSTGALVGVRRPGNAAEEHDLLPISADYPTAESAPIAGYAAGPICPHTSGMNVLYAGGNVRTTTSPLIGPNGDHIFQSIYGRPEAGANRADVVLGRPGDRP